jgi:hypothetical protein
MVPLLHHDRQERAMVEATPFIGPFSPFIPPGLAAKSVSFPEVGATAARATIYKWRKWWKWLWGAPLW